MGNMPPGLAKYMAAKKAGAPANDSKTAPTKYSKSAPASTPPAKAAAPADPNEYGGFKLKEKVMVPSLNGITGTIEQLTNHAGKPVCEVKLSNGHTDWFTLKEIASVPTDPVPAVVPNADPSMPPAAPGDPSETASA